MIWEKWCGNDFYDGNKKKEKVSLTNNLYAIAYIYVYIWHLIDDGRIENK